MEERKTRENYHRIHSRMIDDAMDGKRMVKAILERDRTLAHSRKPPSHPLSSIPHSNRTLALSLFRTFSMMLPRFPLTIVHCIRDWARVTDSIIPGDHGFISISLLTVVPFRAKALGLVCHHSLHLIAAMVFPVLPCPPIIFLHVRERTAGSTCLRLRREDVARSAVHSCENPERDLIVCRSIRSSRSIRSWGFERVDRPRLRINPGYRLIESTDGTESCLLRSPHGHHSCGSCS